MIKYYDLSDVVDFYTYNETYQKFCKSSSTLTPYPNTNKMNHPEVIDIVSPIITVDEKEWLKKKTEVGNLAEFLFSKYIEREGWKYEHTAKKNDKKGYDFKVYEGLEPSFYEVKMLNKSNRFFITRNELLACSYYKDNYNLFLVRKKVNFYTGFIFKSPYLFLNIEELNKKNLLIKDEHFTIYTSTVEIIINDGVFKDLESIIFNVQINRKIVKNYHMKNLSSP